MPTTKKSARSSPILKFKDGRKSAKVGEVVVLNNGAHAKVYLRKDSVGHKYASLKFVSPSKKKSSASKTKSSPAKTKSSPTKKDSSPTKKKSSPTKKKSSPKLELKPRSITNFTRNDFCF